MALPRNRSLRPGALPGRHLDDGHGLWRYADRVAVHCHRCGAPGWVLQTGTTAARFRCLGCSTALEAGCGCARCGQGDWVGPVAYSGRRPCGYCGHQWVTAGGTRKVASPPLKVMPASCAQCGRSSDVAVSVTRYSGAEMIDPHLGMPLRLVEKTAAGVVWAYNEAHLQALQDYAMAPLRERAGVSNGSMFSRLPQWMKLARHRVLLQKATARLLAKAHSTR